jgi:anthranilate phosphoribosyltransferase
MHGEDRGPHRDCLLLGTSLALEVAGEVQDPREGVERAASAIDGGAARRVLETLASLQQRSAPSPALPEQSGASPRVESGP